MRRTSVLISGASIAGPALAYWLHRHGFEVTVVERAPRLRPGGQAVDIRGVARQVVASMGLLENVRETALHQHGLSYVDASGKVLARLSVDAFGGDGIVSEIEILRGDLSRVLFDATAGEVEYLFGDTVTGLEQDDDGVTVRFENAGTRRFGLVIGADGLHSAVRQLGFAPDSECVQSLGCYTAWFTAPAAPDLDGWFEMHNIPGGRVASVRPGRLDTECKASLSFREHSSSIAVRDPAEQRRVIDERFAGVGWRVPWLLEAMRTADDFAFDSMGQVHLDRWSSGRLALVGDAGYCPSPLTGLGTSLGLVGAYILAGELSRAEGHAAAFARYEELMRPYVARAQELPPGGVRGYAPNSRLAIKLQTASVRSWTRWPMRPILARVFAKADAIDLPSYDCAVGRSEVGGDVVGC
ncbi:FAD-binding monooxygenase [Skermania sp. ID1734]|uniref:FAD-dependent monooxygenase n=1 Tax=Skermania sp. ID1734 TaxID=2597516 RepID=UPI00117C9705|nr:FAD-dependent monooxygenase [Skermania sp. ID1734]TSD99728.1 FAD-binding monooxygenase [Skermania sp. ID1734]